MVIPRVLLACVATLWTATALGQEMDPREVQARKDCLSGKVEAGIALLAELFAETDNPNFVYNQARCLEQNSQPDQAIQRFREYKRIARNLSAEEAADIEKHIAECKAMKAEQEQAKVAPAPAPGPVVPTPPVPDAAIAGPQPTAPPRPGAGLRKGGVTVAAIGVAAIGAGVTFSLLAHSTEASIEADGRKGLYDPDKYDRGRRFATLQWVGYGVGAAGIAAGVTLYYLGHRRAATESAPAVALCPFLAAGQGGVLLRGGF